jgi:hypothetical protein
VDVQRGVEWKDHIKFEALVGDVAGDGVSEEKVLLDRMSDSAKVEGCVCEFANGMVKVNPEVVVML